MAFNSEEKFEQKIIKMLSQKGWEAEVLYHSTEQDLIRN